MIVAKPPQSFQGLPFPWIFLAGVIDMGRARDWQSLIADALDDVDGTLLNPRRDDWDSSWTQSIDNPMFREQVDWELQAQESADLIIVHFDHDSSAPITLLELGLNIGANRKVIVHCAEGYYRKGNVNILCCRYSVPQYRTFGDLIEGIRKYVQFHCLEAI